LVEYHLSWLSSLVIRCMSVCGDTGFVSDCHCMSLSISLFMSVCMSVCMSMYVCMYVVITVKLCW